MTYLLTENDIEFLADGIAVDDFAHDLARAVERVVTAKLAAKAMELSPEEIDKAYNDSQGQPLREGDKRHVYPFVYAIIAAINAKGDV